MPSPQKKYTALIMMSPKLVAVDTDPVVDVSADDDSVGQQKRQGINSGPDENPGHP